MTLRESEIEQLTALRHPARLWNDLVNHVGVIELGCICKGMFGTFPTPAASPRVEPAPSPPITLHI
jgi:hypothetical protein